jgi:hypothetical protein
MKNKKPSRKIVELWYEFITGLGCMVNNKDCGNGLNRHHLTHGGNKRHDLRTIPLCHNHHSRDSPLPIGDAYHKGTKAWERKHGSQEQMLLDLREQYEQEHGERIWLP